MKTAGLFASAFAGWMCLLATETPAQIPVIGNYNVYYGSLHNHTAVSDGTGTPDQAYKYARDVARLDFFGLAEHSNMMSSTEWTTIKNAANANNQEGTFAALYGFEWTTFLSYGHVAIVGTDDYCSTGTATSTFTKLLGWINARSGFAFFNHPGWDKTAFNEFNHFTDTPSDKFVGMELWNDMDGFSKYYYNDGFYSGDGKGYFDEALTRKWKIGAAGADDNHDSDWGTATDFRVGVLASNLSRNDITEAFKARRFFSTLDKNLALSFKVNGAEMGASVSGGNLNFLIQATDGNNEMFTQVVLVKNGATLMTWNMMASNPVISEYYTCVSGDYFYVRVKQVDGEEAISSPVFISATPNLPPTVSITYPSNGSTFQAGGTIALTALASDADGTIGRVEFYEGANLLGTDQLIPYEYSWSPAAGSYTLTARAYDNTGASAVSAPVSVTVTAPTPGIAKAAILSGDDDAEQYANGKMILNSDDVDLVYDSKTSGNQTVGLYFRNLGIPAGAIISNAQIQFVTYKRTTNTCSLNIKGQLSGNPAGFTTATGDLSGRAPTTASVSWTPAGWSTVGAAGAAQLTPNLKTIVQEIVNFSGGTNNLVILITGTGTRTAYSYESAPAMAAVLKVEYAVATPQPQEVMKSGGTALKDQALLPGQAVQEVQLQLYPNPVTDKLNIRINGEAFLEQIEIYSANGVLMDRKMMKGNLQDGTVDCSSLVPGTYVLMAKTTRGNYSLKFVRQ